MKINLASTHGRATIGALFSIIGLTFAIVALLPIKSQSAPRKSAKLRQSPVGRASAISAATPAPQDPGPPIGYENFQVPGVTVPVTTTEAGQQVHSVEWMGRNAGEPSIGSNFATGVA